MNDAAAVPEPESTEPTKAILSVNELVTEFRVGAKYVRAVDQVSLNLQPGEIIAIVGESGSGKSVLLQSILGLARGRPGVVSGSVTLRLNGSDPITPFEGIESSIQRKTSQEGKTSRISVSRRFMAQVERRLAPVRGTEIGLVLQNGRAALDPFWPIGRQIEIAIGDRHPTTKAEARKTQAHDWLMRLGFENPTTVASAYPHELSGGMAQRAMLAVVLAREPKILFLDEITTGLDVSLQASVLKLLRRLHLKEGFAALLVTHDLGLARNISSRTVIMQRGRIVQEGATEAIFEQKIPLEPYAAQLLKLGKLDGMNRVKPMTESLPGPVGPTPLIVADQVGKRFATRPQKGGWRAKPEVVHALAQVSLEIPQGQAIALVGESGSGKTTLSRILVGLLQPDDGNVTFDGQRLDTLDPVGVERFRRRRTILFQNPYTSLNPEMSAEGVVAEALDLYRSITPRMAKNGAQNILERLSLGRRAKNRLAELSGGERRRVGLLRAMQSNADLIVLDEPTAGLDAVHKSDVAELIHQLRAHRPERVVLIVSHDLGFVSRVADRILVMYRGHLVEDVGVDDFMDADTTHHPYTELLWKAARFVGGQEATLPAPSERRTDLQELEAPTTKVGGCLYRARCPIHLNQPERWSQCVTDVPPLSVVDQERSIACHGVLHDDKRS